MYDHPQNKINSDYIRMRSPSLPLSWHFGPPPLSGFIAEPKCSSEAWRNLESTFQSGVLCLIGGCDGSSVDTSTAQFSLAEGLVLIETPGAVRAGKLVWTIGSFEIAGTEKAYSSKLNRVAVKALKGLY